MKHELVKAFNDIDEHLRNERFIKLSKWARDMFLGKEISLQYVTIGRVSGTCLTVEAVEHYDGEAVVNAILQDDAGKIKKCSDIMSNLINVS